MIYSFHIDQVFCLEHGLNLAEGGVYDFCYRLPAWAESVILSGQTWYFGSRTKAVSEIKLVSAKPDTIYRHYKKLESLGLIFYKKFEGKDLIRLNPKFSREWNRKPLGKISEDSEKNPNLLGKISENHSEKFPTYNNTSNYNNTKDKRESAHPKKNELKDLKNELKKLPITPDADSTLSATLIYFSYLETEFFKNQWNFYADRYPAANPKEVLKSWCAKGNWQDVRDGRINNCFGGQWIANSHKQNQKDGKSNITRIEPGKYGDNGLKKFG